MSESLWHLAVQVGPKAGSSIALSGSPLTIGRRPDNDIVIDHFAVSRYHARLTRQGEAYLIEDLGSVNGTWVNGVRISQPVLLKAGDSVGLGSDVQATVGATRPQPGMPPEPKPGRPRRKRRLAAALALGIVVSAIIGGGLAAALLLWPERVDKLLGRGDDGKLSLEPRAADGAVSGSYRPPENMGDTPVLFGVTSDGLATFRLKGAPAEETLTVALSEEQTASMTWGGVTLDGLGALTAEEQDAMDSLLVRHYDLLNGLEMIPLELACLGEEVIDAKQVAALLFPVQMRSKYADRSRQSTASHLISLSTCDYGTHHESRAAHPSVLQLTPAMPVPVVFGYFPFDPIGAVESPASLAAEPQLACLGFSAAKAPSRAAARSAAAGGQAAPAAAGLDEWGPCYAMCRGACGSDCTLNNCKYSTTLRCEKDTEGQNTGMRFTVFQFDCGVHQGCVEHDACYDSCNETFGCGTWEAAYCRHGRAETPATMAADVTLRGYSYCDEQAWLKYGTLYGAAWSQGYGPQPLREVFEYTDITAGGQDPQDFVYDAEACPRPTALDEERASDDLGAEGEGGEGQHSIAPPAETHVAAPTAPRAAAPTATPTAALAPLPTRTAAPTAEPTATEGLLVWVKQDPPVVNVNKDPLESQSQEERFKGSFTKFAPSETSFTWQEKYVDHGSEGYDVSITCQFDTAPVVLNPGLRYPLRVNCSHGGAHNWGGEGLGWQFWYSAQRGYEKIVEPQEVLAYYPWSPNFDGTAGKEWMLAAPPMTRLGDTFQVYAGWWNCAPCNVTWTYRAEYH